MSEKKLKEEVINITIGAAVIGALTALTIFAVETIIAVDKGGDQQ